MEIRNDRAEQQGELWPEFSFEVEVTSEMREQALEVANRKYRWWKDREQKVAKILKSREIIILKPQDPFWQEVASYTPLLEMFFCFECQRCGEKWADIASKPLKEFKVAYHACKAGKN